MNLLRRPTGGLVLLALAGVAAAATALSGRLADRRRRADAWASATDRLD